MNRIENTSRSDLDLIAAACSPEATEQQLRALESACAEDEGLAQLYLEFCHFEWVCQLRERSELANRLAKASLSELPADDKEPLLSDDRDGTGIDVAPVRRRKLRDRFADQIEPDKHLLHFAAVVAFITLGSWAYFIEFVGRPAFHHDDVATVVPKESEEPQPEARRIARLINTVGAVWGESKRWRVDDGFEEGDTLELKQGLAEIHYDHGVRVILQGPALFEIGGEKGGRLKRGRLVARVLEKGKGFIVETPTALVVDLGTEFGVSVDHHGQTDTEVITGKIEVFLAKDGRSIGQGLTLIAGAAAHVDSDGGSIIKSHPTGNFVRSLRGQGGNVLLSAGEPIEFTANIFDADTDISTLGELVTAVNLGSPHAVTVNGVKFAPDTTNSLFTDDGRDFINEALYGGGAIGSLTAEEANLLLDSVEFGPGNGNSLARLSGLTVGRTYLVQLIVADDRPGSKDATVAFGHAKCAGHPDELYTLPGLDHTSTHPYVVMATFVAQQEAIDLHVQHSEGENGVVNAFQLRAFRSDEEPAVPPSVESDAGDESLFDEVAP